MTKLTASQVKVQRDKMLSEQGGLCMLCCERIEAGADVLDHDHKTGRVRAVLHRGCNAMLGKIENARRINHLLGSRLGNMLSRVEQYINSDYSHHPVYPTHRTVEEKKERAKKLARKRYAAKKEAA